MSRWGIFRRWQRWAVLEAVELYWDCRCAYHNAASFRCYFCGSRRPLDRYAGETDRHSRETGATTGTTDQAVPEVTTDPLPDAPQAVQA